MAKACLSLMAALCGVAFGGTIVVPNGNATTAGNDNLSGPATATPGIIQELYGAGQFSGPIEITAMSFRAATGTGAVDLSFGSLSVYLSISSAYPNNNGGVSPQLSTTFADNIASTQVLVYSGSNVTLSDAGCAGPAPCPFDMTLNFITPFLYTPLQMQPDGRLLAEFVFTGLQSPADTGGLDLMDTTFPPGGNVAVVYALGSDTATTGTVDYTGLITEFTETSVPEPGSLVMMAAGAASLVSIRRSISAGWKIDQ